MPKYFVSWDEICSYIVEIEADSYKDALTVHSYREYTETPEEVYRDIDLDSIRCEERWDT